MRHRPAGRGFTLVECAVVCAIVGILGAVALPSLRGHELRSARIDAVDALTRLQAAQEQHRLAHLRPGEEPLTTAQEVADADLGERLLERLGLAVGAVEHRDLARRRAGFDRHLDRIGGERERALQPPQDRAAAGERGQHQQDEDAQQPTSCGLHRGNRIAASAAYFEDMGR